MENFLIAFGCTLIGYGSRVILSEYKLRMLSRENKELQSHLTYLIGEYKKSEYERKKTKESFLDLRRRYDKIYSNNYSKFK